VNAAGKQSAYGNLFSDFDANYKAIAPYALAREYFNEVFVRNTELTAQAYKVYQLMQVYETKGEQAFNDRKANLIKGSEDFYKDFNPKVDEKVFEKLLSLYIAKSPLLTKEISGMNAEKTVSDVYSQSAFTTYSGFKQLLDGDAKSVIGKLNGDKGYQLVKAVADNYLKNVAPKYDETNLKIIALQRSYMKAILELDKDGRNFPDANSTLRVTYGKVKGYKPSDAVTYGPFTYLDGVMEKYIPGDYEFDVPKKLIDLYNNKDYGRYGQNGKMPVCYIGTNHTTGGNSGSPALDKKGYLVGLNFDRVWEGTMSDIHYDPDICRNIMVDIRYVLFVVDKFAGDKRLIDEMKIID
ncbi:MAG: serine protease, partial [Flavobacterium sp.]